MSMIQSVMPTYTGHQGTPFQRFWEKIKIDPETGCWLWTASKTPDGYGRWRPYKDQTMKLVHRWTFQTFIGIIDPDMQIDHLCRVRHCCNPNHLEAVGHDINMLRARRTHCRNGHEYTDANSYIYEDKRYGWKRACRICVGAAQKRYQAKKKAQVD